MKIKISITQVCVDCFRARCAVLPGCTAVGRNRQEVLEKISELVKGYMASMDASCPDELELVVAGQGDACRPIPTSRPSPEPLGACF